MPIHPFTRIGRWLDALARGVNAAWAWGWLVALAPYFGLRQALAVRAELGAYAALDAAQRALLQHLQLVFYRIEEASANRRLLELDSPAAHQAADEALLAYYRAVVALERQDLPEDADGAHAPLARRAGPSPTRATTG